MEQEIAKTEGKSLTKNVLDSAKEGENLIESTLSKNFRQVREELIHDKVEDIKIDLERKIQDEIRDLKKKSREIQDALIRMAPTGPLQAMNLDGIEAHSFNVVLSEWGIACHSQAMKVLSDINLYQKLFKEAWKDEDKDFARSLIIDFSKI